jgi:hypothetical protein
MYLQSQQKKTMSGFGSLQKQQREGHQIFKEILPMKGANPDKSQL